MYLQRRLLLSCAVVISFIVFAFLRHLHGQDLLHRDPHNVDASTYTRPTRKRIGKTVSGLENGVAGLSSLFHLGSPKCEPSNCSRVVVIPRMKEEDIAWITEELPGTSVSIYVADDPSASLHPPRNKGHEVMVYLTYVIDNYDKLPDIVLFMHAHRWTHHNNEFLGHDAVEMIQRLNDAHVIREGYMNMRCHWNPGCPEWLHPVSTQELLGKQEETVLSKCWGELFPLEPMPTFLAQPCCAQFALSKERLLAIPQSRFIFYRDWILRTSLSDYISGRIWEYIWQYIFTGERAHCPAEHSCYCDAFGLCFGGEAQYKDFVLLHDAKKEFETELKEWQDKERIFEEATRNNVTLGLPSDRGRHAFLREQIEALSEEMNVRKQDAVARGNNPQYRAKECDQN